MSLYGELKKYLPHKQEEYEYAKKDDLKCEGIFVKQGRR